MNAGAHGKEMKDIVVKTTYMDFEGNINTITNEQQEFSYRKSIFTNKKWIILDTVLELPYSNNEDFKIVLEKFVISFVVAEQQAKLISDKEGYIRASTIRHKMNEFLSKVSED